MSEVCSVLTFLLQITILGRDVTRRIKVRSLRYTTVFAELLILLGIAAILFNVVDIALPEHSNYTLHVLDSIVENAGLAFVFIFRLYFLGLSKDGWRLTKTRHRELFLYGLFVTHEYPFTLLNHFTGISWEFVQALYMRLMLVACLWTTLQSKFRLSSAHAASRMSHGPKLKGFPSDITDVGRKDSRPAARVLHGPTTPRTGKAAAIAPMDLAGKLMSKI